MRADTATLLVVCVYVVALELTGLLVGVKFWWESRHVKVMSVEELEQTWNL